MDANLEKRLKDYLPYIVVIGVVFLIVPALLLVNSDAIRYIVLIGLLPLTALLCCAHYAMNHKSDFLVTLIAPVFFVLTMLIYGLVQSDPLRAFIYLIAYFLCGYLGLTLGDILANKKGASAAGSRPARPAPERRTPAADAQEYRPASTRARRVAVENQDDAPAAPRPASPRAHSVAVEAAVEPAVSPRARRVAVEEQPAPKEEPPVDLFDAGSLDQSTTSDDIDAILREIHQRHSND